MGMFDNITCKYPLPLPQYQDWRFQTKDTPRQYLEHYEIREDGTLWYQDHDYEDRSDKTKEGLEGLMGCMTPVNHRWVPQPEFTGDISFYTSTNKKPENGWVEFQALFLKGKLINLEVMEHTPGVPECAPDKHDWREYPNAKPETPKYCEICHGFSDRVTQPA